MSLLAKFGRLNPILNVPQILKNQVKCVSYHYPDWKPGPYPKTKEEREAAAKKYGMLPEEYEPYPDDGSGYGDYPDVPIVSEDAKDLNLPYQVTGLINRNWNDPIPIHYASFTAEKNSTKPEKHGPIFKVVVIVAGILAWCVFINTFIFYPTYHTMAPKQFPFQGEKHYLFEVED